MYKRKRWYDIVPPDKWFFLTPSFWGFLAGTLVGIGANLLTGVLLQANIFSPWIRASAVPFFFAAAAFAYVSVIVETCRANQSSDLIVEIHENKLYLSVCFLLGLIFFTLGVIFICL